jgi:EAL domain-containing protein (putative c-di-GMP-specific phosphodiesterase class I)
VTHRSRLGWLASGQALATLVGIGVLGGVVRSVIHLARDLGLVSLAEGVETRAVWDRLDDLGCEQIQGYVLSRPLPPDQLIEWATGRAPALTSR